MKSIIIVINFLLVHFVLSAQVNTDSIFDAAIRDAHAGNYDEALKKTELVLKKHPDRFDVMVFVANLYAWKGNYSKALNYVLTAAYSYEEFMVDNFRNKFTRKMLFKHKF